MFWENIKKIHFLKLNYQNTSLSNNPRARLRSEQQTQPNVQFWRALCFENRLLRNRCRCLLHCGAWWFGGLIRGSEWASMAERKIYERWEDERFALARIGSWRETGVDLIRRGENWKFSATVLLPLSGDFFRDSIRPEFLPTSSLTDVHTSFFGKRISSAFAKGETL